MTRKLRTLMKSKIDRLISLKIEFVIGTGFCSKENKIGMVRIICLML
jgi:hypothetical protein